MPKPQDIFAPEECAERFMSRSEDSGIQNLIVPSYLSTEQQVLPAFRLPQNCCDLCQHLGALAVRAIGPDLRPTQALFLPSKHYLVLKVHFPEASYKPDKYFMMERYFYIFSHPGMYFLTRVEYTLIVCFQSRCSMSLESLQPIPIPTAQNGF